MNSYNKEIIDNKIIFKDLGNNTELTVEHDDSEYIFDSIFIDRKYDLKFIEYFVDELKKTNDIAILFSLYDSAKLETMLFNKGFRVLNYQYLINYTGESLSVDSYDISDMLDDEAKNFYLSIINKLGKKNYQYLYDKDDYGDIDGRFFDNDEYKYRIYRKDNKIVGIVDFKIFDNEKDKNIRDCFNYSSKLCVRSLLCEDAYTTEDIIKDLLNVYNREIIVSCIYTDKSLFDVIKNMEGKFEFCQYLLPQK